MSIKCSFSEDCTEEISHECIINNNPTYFCHSHLLKTLASGASAQSVKSIELPLNDSSKSLILNSLFKALSQAQNFLQSFKNLALKQIQSILAENQRVEKEIESLNSRIIQAAKLIKEKNSVKSYEKFPEIVKICLEKPEKVAFMLENFKFFEIVNEIKDNQHFSIIVDNMDLMLKSELKLVEPVCNNGHLLMYSQDSNKFYSFISNSSTNVRCDVCKVSSNEICNHCRLCWFDICASCMVRKEFKQRSVPLCINNHPTLFIQNIKNYFQNVFCDRCRNEIFTHSWRCKTCDFDSCEICSLKLGILPLFTYPYSCPLNHRMILSNDIDKFTCSLCNRQLANTDSWKCEQCKIRNCRNCIASLGHYSPKCPKSHETVHKIGKKKSSLWNLGSKSCLKCSGKISDFGFLCKVCDFCLCENCFLTCPQTFINN